MLFVPVAKRNGLTANIHFTHRHLRLFLLGNPLQQRNVWFTGQGDWLHCPLRYRVFYGLFDVKRHSRQRKPVDINSILDYRYYYKYIPPNNCIPNLCLLQKSGFPYLVPGVVIRHSAVFGTHNIIQIMWNGLYYSRGTISCIIARVFLTNKVFLISRQLH